MAVASPLRSLKPTSFSASVIALGGVIALLYFGRVFLITLSIAVAIAFILEPFVGLLIRLRLPRPLASFVVCSIAICLLYLVGLGAYTQGAGLVEDLPKYQQRVNEITDTVLGELESMERRVYEFVVPKRLREQVIPPQPTPPPRPVSRRRPRTPEPLPQPQPQPPGVQEVRIRPERPPLVDFLYSHLGSVYQAVLMASFVPFLVYFMLSWRDHVHRSFLQLFDEEARVAAAGAVEGIASMVRAFVVGNFVLGLLLAIASTVVFWLFGLPYPLLIGPLSGLFSLIPYIGMPLAVVPPFLAGLTVSIRMAPYIAVLSIIALLHVLAMNLLYPKIVGPRVHLNPLVVTVALMFWSVLWGAAGLMLAIPLTAGLKAVCDNVDRLHPYGKLLGD